MTMTELEIIADYRQAKDPAAQIKVLADLNACKSADICKVLLAHPESGFKNDVKVPDTTRKPYSKRTSKKVSEIQCEDVAPSKSAVAKTGMLPVTAASVLQSIMPILAALPSGGVFDMSCELEDGRTITIGLWPRATKQAAKRESLQQTSSTKPV